MDHSRRKLLDRIIAAQALVAGATLVTLNGDDFRDVPGLDLLERRGRRLRPRPRRYLTKS